MSLLEKSGSHVLSGDSDEKEFESHGDKLYKLGLGIAQLAKQLGNEKQIKNRQSHLVLIDELEKTCKTFLNDLSLLKASLMKPLFESKPIISLLTVEYHHIYIHTECVTCFFNMCGIIFLFCVYVVISHIKLAWKKSGLMFFYM